MPTIPADVSILWILAAVVLLIAGLLIFMVKWAVSQTSKLQEQMTAELKARTAADIELVKIIIKINNSLQETKATLHRGHRAILDSIKKLTETTIERERQRRRDD